ncbi:hypothetical protein LOK49_LG03G03214 [Camellia lanceoleosa]|uniref:Uncharacterized protein n=1 Tax=Camellia lanceoleosa TaxID=1840588 RepID=A0ACC0I6S6_9ERIC|nr:hypothetical protein LOK49_LG03G03214 [Camellia lanceoleosa]
MNGYSKIKLVGSTKSRSIDFSDLHFPPQNLKPIEETSPNNTPKIQEPKQMKNTSTRESPPDVEHEEVDENGERFGVILRRNFSVSSTASNRSKFDKQGTTTRSLQSAVKRAFSIRRSSSVSERYCRIHDQCVTLASSSSFDDHDGDEMMDKNNSVETRSMEKIKKKHRSGKILKACKRVFGL